MDFTITCQCGESTTVTEAAAGRAIDCSCGRTIKVPSFRELRECAGLPADNVSPVLLITHLLVKGELYPPADCVWCAAESDAVLHLQIDCERAWVRGGGFRWGVLLTSLLLPVKIFSWEPGEEHGKDLIFELPVTVCLKCRHRLEPRRRRNILPIVRWVLLVMAIGALFVRPLVAVGFAAGFALMCLLETSLTRKRVDPLKETLQKVPLYAQLLDRYPDAVVRQL